MKTVYAVRTAEYERGYGQRDIETTFFKTEVKALDFVKEYNKENTASYAPDTYWRADFLGKREIPDNKDIR